MRKMRKNTLKMRTRPSCFAPELFSADCGVWESGPHVRRGENRAKTDIFSRTREEIRLLDREKCIENSNSWTWRNWDVREVVEFEEIIRIFKSARGSSCKRSIVTDLEVFAHVDRSLRPHGTPNLCGKQLGTILNAIPSVYDANISKSDQKLSKITKIDQNRPSEKFDFPTVKVAKNWHTVSSRYSERLPCVKGWGMGRFLIRHSKVTKSIRYLTLHVRYGDFSGILVKNGRFHCGEICSKCVTMR